MVTKENHSFIHFLVLGIESMDSRMFLLSYTPHLESQHLNLTCLSVLEALYLTKSIRLLYGLGGRSEGGLEG